MTASFDADHVANLLAELHTLFAALSAAYVFGSAVHNQMHAESDIDVAIDIELGKLLQMTSAKLKSTLANATLVVVRSQEIDKLGEMDGDFIARQMMDTVLQNILI